MGLSYAYAIDIAVESRDITKLPHTINEVEKWCSKQRNQGRNDKYFVI